MTLTIGMKLAHGIGGNSNLRWLYVLRRHEYDLLSAEAGIDVLNEWNLW